MDNTDTLIDPESEVRKLQDLVKKLEKQNYRFCLLFLS
jgi:hypothetical protein